MTDNNAARAWLDGLAARGISTRIVGGRIRHFPASAFRQLTDGEVIFLRHNRGAVKAVLSAPDVPGKGPEIAPGPIPTPEPAPPCPHCYRAPCVGSQHELYDLLHPLTEAQVYRRRMAQQARDVRERELRRIFGAPSPAWDL